MPAVDAQQLRALVAAVVQPSDSRRVVAVRSDSGWTGPELLDGPIPIRVVACASPLAVRAALVDDSGDEGVLAILTPCGDRDLGLDVLARLAKGKVLPVDPYSAVLALFGARVLDPTLVRDERWMLDDLIALAPPGGWPNRSISGVLDIDTAWQVWHAARLGRDAPPDLDAVIVVGADPALEVALRDLDDVARRRVATRWAGGARPADLLLELVAAGRGTQLGALGLVAEVLWAPTEDARLAEQQRLARARMEPVLGRDRLDERSSRAWADAVRRAPDDHVGTFDLAERILADAEVGDLAILSDDLVPGFNLRLVAVAASVSAGDLGRAEAALAWLRRHRLADTQRNRLQKAEAAIRVLRRTGAGAATSSHAHLPALSKAYANDGAWVDEARLLLADGDMLPDVAAVYARICAQLDEERRAGDLAFAAALAEWSKSEPVADDRIIPVEHVLDRIVARVAADAPVLVIVGDGVSLPVTHQLLASLADHGWARATPVDIESWPTGVAMLPTVTEVSRASLLSGERIDGGQKEEAAGFDGHPGLRRVSAAGANPLLFHKGQLVGASGHTLADEVQAAVANPAQRIVGVVLNAVDDHLSRGQQVKVTWDVETMGPLGALLEAARDSGRVVVLTADHGHVIHGEGAVLRPAKEVGERWRLPSPAAAADEVEVSGPRVLKGGRIVLPADDRIRYGGHKHGYHGGACPHEVLVPVEVVARVLPDGWVHRPLPKPAWWTGQVEPAWAPPAVLRSAPTTRPAQPTLFEPEPSSEQAEAPMTAVPVMASTGASPLIDRLLASPTLAAQRQRNARSNAISDERIGRYLQLVLDNGGTIPLATLADRTGEPHDHLRMSLTVVRRLLNFDGTEVLAVTAANDVELSAAQLAVQFDLGTSTP